MVGMVMETCRDVKEGGPDAPRLCLPSVFCSINLTRTPLRLDPLSVSAWCFGWRPGRKHLMTMGCVGRENQHVNSSIFMFLLLVQASCCLSCLFHVPYSSDTGCMCLLADCTLGVLGRGGGIIKKKLPQKHIPL